MISERDFEARIRFVTKADGGRYSPVRSNYRPQLHYPGAKADWVLHINWIDKEEVFPGEEAIASCMLLSPWYHLDHVFPGSTFEVREGQKVVAHATVTKLLALKENAERQRLEAENKGELLDPWSDGLPCS